MEDRGEQVGKEAHSVRDKGAEQLDDLKKIGDDASVRGNEIVGEKREALAAASDAMIEKDVASALRSDVQPRGEAKGFWARFFGGAE